MLPGLLSLGLVITFCLLVGVRCYTGVGGFFFWIPVQWQSQLIIFSPHIATYRSS